LRRAASFHPSPRYVKGVGQRIDSLAGIVSGVGREMGVSGGCQDTDMAQDLLQFDKINPCFQQMRCIAVTQGMA